ncbi:MAG TPA: hypothetical protein VEA16_13030 [Vicinamibacterales bacterium]|nr:hypothetical protein [Vicinamibacterales bacterium]
MVKALTVALVIATTLAAASAQGPVAIGIVRKDGLLMPITVLTGQLFTGPPFPAQTFVNGEPIGDDTTSGPAQLLANRTWLLSPGPGRTPVPLRTTETVVAWMPYCEDRLMWRTTLRPSPLDQGVAPVSKLGMAVSGASISFPEDVSAQPDAPSRRVGRRIVSLFLLKEKERLAQEKGPYAVSAAPGSPPVVIRELRRHTFGQASTYYFEATKSLRTSEGSIAPDAGLVTGWLVDSSAGLKDFEVTYKVNDDAYKENERAIVRGIVNYAGKALWLLEWHGWEHEYYTLHEWPAGIVRLRMNAYNC